MSRPDVHFQHFQHLPVSRDMPGRPGPHGPRRPSGTRHLPASRLAAIVLTAIGLVAIAGCGAQKQVAPRDLPADRAETPPSAPEAAAPGQTRLEQAASLYQASKFERAAEVLEVYLREPQVSRESRIEALQLQASSFAAMNDTARARQNVEKILDLDESHDIPINRVPPALARAYLGVLDARGLLQAAPPGVKTVAVVDFENASLTHFDEVGGLGKGVAALLISELIEATDATKVRVVERMELDYVLREHEMSRADLVDPETAIRAGKLLGAQSFIFGSFIRNNEQLTILPRIVVTETGRLVKSFRRDGSMADIGSIVHAVADEVVEELGVLANQRPVRHISTEAIQAFTQGEDLLRDGELDQALARFERASSLSPGWRDAQDKIQMLRPLVAPRARGLNS